MKKAQANIIIIYSLILAFLLSSSTSSFAQAKYHGQTFDLTISGTSSLHDWEMKSSKGQFDASISIANDNVIFTGLSFSMPAESLKSGHGMMDRNTYKALNTEKNPNISFVLSSGTVKPQGSNTYLFNAVGNLTISGTTILTELVAILKYNPVDKSFSCTGTKKLKMTQYGVKPPTVMLGTIKTGDDISISYNLNIKS